MSPPSMEGARAADRTRCQEQTSVSVGACRVIQAGPSHPESKVIPKVPGGGGGSWRDAREKAPPCGCEDRKGR